MTVDLGGSPARPALGSPLGRGDCSHQAATAPPEARGAAALRASPRRSFDEAAEVMLCPICEDTCSCDGQTELTVRARDRREARPAAPAAASAASAEDGRASVPPPPAGGGGSNSDAAAASAAATLPTKKTSPAAAKKGGVPVAARAATTKAAAKAAPQRAAAKKGAATKSAQAVASVARARAAIQAVPKAAGDGAAVAPPASTAAARGGAMDIDAQLALSEYYFSDGEDGSSSFGDEDGDWMPHAGATDEEGGAALADYYGYSTGSSDFALESLLFGVSDESDADYAAPHAAAAWSVAKGGDAAAAAAAIPSANSATASTAFATTDGHFDGDLFDNILSPPLPAAASSGLGNKARAAGQRATAAASPLSSAEGGGGGTTERERAAGGEESLNEQLAKITPQILAAISLAAKQVAAASSTSRLAPAAAHYGWRDRSYAPLGGTPGLYASLEGAPAAARRSAAIDIHGATGPSGRALPPVAGGASRAMEEYERQQPALTFDEIIDTKKMKALMSTSPPASVLAAATQSGLHRRPLCQTPPLAAGACAASERPAGRGAGGVPSGGGASGASERAAQAQETMQEAAAAAHGPAVRRANVPIDAFRRSRRSSIQVGNVGRLAGALRQNSLATCMLFASTPPSADAFGGALAAAALGGGTSGPRKRRGSATLLQTGGDGSLDGTAAAAAALCGGGSSRAAYAAMSMASSGVYSGSAAAALCAGTRRNLGAITQSQQRERSESIPSGAKGAMMLAGVKGAAARNRSLSSVCWSSKCSGRGGGSVAATFGTSPTALLAIPPSFEFDSLALDDCCEEEDHHGGGGGHTLWTVPNWHDVTGRLDGHDEVASGEEEEREASAASISLADDDDECDGGGSRRGGECYLFASRI